MFFYISWICNVVALLDLPLNFVICMLVFFG
jgi:hypothetical protein